MIRHAIGPYSAQLAFVSSHQGVQKEIYYSFIALVSSHHLNLFFYTFKKDKISGDITQEFGRHNFGPGDFRAT